MHALNYNPAFHENETSLECFVHAAKGMKTLETLVRSQGK